MSRNRHKYTDAELALLNDLGLSAIGRRGESGINATGQEHLANITAEVQGSKVPVLFHEDPDSVQMPKGKVKVTSLYTTKGSPVDKAGNPTEQYPVSRDTLKKWLNVWAQENTGHSVTPVDGGFLVVKKSGRK